MHLSLVFSLVSVFGCVHARFLQKYINPCGIVYSSVTLDVHGIRHIVHAIKPHIMGIVHLLKDSHHKIMDDYTYRRTWIPDEMNLMSTTSPLNFAKQLPEIYRSLQYFSYALDLVQQDTQEKHERTDGCFFLVDTLPIIIEKHQELVCATDSAMGQLNIEVPTIKMVDLPNDWSEPQGVSCVDKFFRFSEVHTKYKRFLMALYHLSIHTSHHQESYSRK